MAQTRDGQERMRSLEKVALEDFLVYLEDNGSVQYHVEISQKKKNQGDKREPRLQYVERNKQSCENRERSRDDRKTSNKKTKIECCCHRLGHSKDN